MLKLNQQILVRNGHVNFNQTFSQLNHQYSYSKIQMTPNKRKKSLDYSQNLQTQINFYERKKQNSIPDIILQQSNSKKCYTYTNNQIDKRDQEIFIKKIKAIQNQDISPKRISQEASPLQNIKINRKRCCISENKKELFSQKEQLIKTKYKVPYQLQLLNQDLDQSSNRITIKASNQINEEIFVIKQIETPGTAQFMQSNKDENFLFQNDNSNENKINDDQEQKCYPSQQIYQRKLSCQEESFMPVQKTIPSKKPYFQSKKGGDVQISKLECKGMMTILDQEQNRILESIGQNASQLYNSPKREELKRSMKRESYINKETEIIEQHYYIQSKRYSIKDENKPYWELREMSQQKKKR